MIANIFVHRHNCQTERTEANANAAFIWSKERGNMAAFYTTEMTSLSVEDTSKLPQFDGFALSFITLDGPNCTVSYATIFASYSISIRLLI